MGIFDEITRSLGLPRAGRLKKKSKSAFPPDLGEVKEIVEKAMDSLSQIKDIPKTVIDRVVEAESDFREADRGFRGCLLYTSPSPRDRS